MRVTRLICGPPGAGKMLLVELLAEPGDVIVNLEWSYFDDRGLPWRETPASQAALVEKLRALVLARIPPDDRDPEAQTWIVIGAANGQERQELRRRLGATAWVIETPAEACKAVLARDEEMASDLEYWGAIVDKWWAEYEPDPRAEGVVMLPFQVQGREVTVRG